MTDNLGGVQRHSSDAFWADYKIYVLSLRTSPDFWIRIQRSLEVRGIRYAPQFIFRKGVRKFALLIDDRDREDFLTLVEQAQISVYEVLRLGATGSDGSRMLYNGTGQPSGMLIARGHQHSNQFKDLAIFDVNTGEYFEPRMHGFLRRAPGQLTVSVNTPSEGARYHDQA